MRSYFLFLFSILSALLIGCAQKGVKRCPASPNYGQCLAELTRAAPRESETLMSSTAGIEFEGSAPNALEFVTIAEFIETKLKQQFADDQVWIEEEPFPYIESAYHVRHHRGGWIDTYTVKYEGGIVSEPRLEPEVKGLEITSPIMRNEEQVSFFISLLDQLRSIGVKSRPDRGGIHIHWGVNPDETLARVSELFSVADKLFRSAFQSFAFGSERREHFLDLPGFAAYANNFRAVAAENPNQTLAEGDTEQLEKKKSLLRYLPDYSTIENRLFGSTLNPELNRFYFEFTRKLFEAWGDAGSSELWGYLKDNDEPSFAAVVELMGFKPDRVQDLIEQASEKVQGIEGDLRSRSLRQLPSQFVLATETERLVDEFWSAEMNSRSLAASLRRFRSQVSERDQQIGLFNIVNHAKFMELSESEQRLLIAEIRDLFTLNNFMTRELWALDISLQEQLGLQLGRAVNQVNLNDPGIGHPLVRWILKRLERNEIELQAFARGLDQTSGSIEKFLILFEAYMQTRRPRQKDIHFALLAVIVEESDDPLAAMSALRILETYRVEFQSQRVLLTPLLDAIAKKSVNANQKIYLGLLTFLNQLTQNSPHLANEEVSDPNALMNTGVALLQQGNFPRLLVQHMDYARKFKKRFQESRFAQLEEAWSAAISEMRPGLTEQDISAIKSSYRDFTYGIDLPIAARLSQQLESL